MKYLICLCVSLVTVFAKAQTSDTLSIASFNIRIKTSKDSGNQAWSERLPYVTQLIKNYDFDVCGIQEMSSAMQTNLMAKLSDYAMCAFGRDSQDGADGERLGILYKKDRFTIQDNGAFWFSTTPDSVSYGWNETAYRRICLWTKMLDSYSNKSFYVFCVHMPLQATARKQAMILLVQKMQSIAGTDPLYCMGDFNASSWESASYGIITKYYQDSRTVSQTSPLGYAGTYNGFNMTATSFSENDRIDFIFTTESVFSYTAINDKFVEDAYPSDHFPIMIRTKISGDDTKLNDVSQQNSLYFIDSYTYRLKFSQKEAVNVYSAVGSVLLTLPASLEHIISLQSMSPGVYLIATADGQCIKVIRK